TQGTVRAIWESLDRPYRAAMEQSLIYTRLGNPIGMAEAEADAKESPAGGTGGTCGTPDGNPTAGRLWRLR
ncbi:enoyl-CoA hydratase/isomerase family protein, partial [Parafrankia sp. FMc6]